MRVNEYGHISKNCQRQNRSQQRTDEEHEEVRRSYVIEKRKEEVPGYTKIVLNDQFHLNGLVDTGSDLNILNASTFLQIGAPKFHESHLSIKGIGNSCIKTLGRFTTKITIDECNFTTDFYIVSDDEMPMKLIIGKPILEKVTLIIDSESIKVVQKSEEVVTKNTNETNELPDLFLIDVGNNLDVGKSEYLREIENMISKYRPKEPKETKVITKIILTDEIPVYQQPRRLSHSEKAEVDRQITEWLQKGIIRPSVSDYASPIVLVKKKNGSTRICVDYRRLNRKVVRDRYPLPIIEDQIDKLSKAKIFTTLDLKNGFFHVPVTEESIKYTSFVTPNGQFEFLKTPFGYCNSPSVFQRYINDVFRQLMLKGIVLSYMDDIIIPAENIDEAFQKLKLTLDTAQENGLEINWEKCQFMKTNVEYLGHEIENGMVKPSFKKIAAVINFPEPTSIKKVQSFLGLTGYFRKYVKDYALIAKPLTERYKKFSNGK